ncbi:hypothetical protein L593_06195 [Salinarchaeum sp. Harcht-Bsk1]|uniref:DUF1059 domain-containing protein n=1 Tax=Salinarchaeum sp. Harcht-Bsk1 TaxID=1333523 RepID=UPI0003424856|nr:DUF1059 domain-containing protein [Salinarchaeum sp. Harcht-Bsk1]AGN01188.1 hypothetical protein L593_06195 [Salinarchaeum sp. Harcht-Bsk1]
MATEFDCHQDAGFECDFHIVDENEDELVDFVQIHGRSAHDTTVEESDIREMLHT